MTVQSGAKMKTGKMLAPILASLAMGVFSSVASAAPIYWTDWTGGDLAAGAAFQAQGTITTSTSTVTVTYSNPLGVAFYQPSGGTNYWTGGTDGAAGTSPYTSTAVDNRPGTSDIIALTNAGNQTLTFSQSIANPVFAYVSLNGNGYAFLDQDFDILSFGDASNGNACGYWGCGTSYKNIVNLGNGHTEYQLLGTGEPHGAIQFKGAFDTVTWRSLSSEYWNGFTIGVQGTTVEVLPEPGSLAMLGLGLVGLAFSRRRKQAA